MSDALTLERGASLKAPVVGSPFKPGEKKAYPIGPFSYQEVQDYCRFVEDANVIHVHHQEALRWCQERGHKRLPVGKQVLVPGMLAASRLPGLMRKAFGHGVAVVGFKDPDSGTPFFRRPLFTNEEAEAVITCLVVEDMGIDWIMRCELSVTVVGPKRAFLLMAGEFRMTVPKVPVRV